MKTERSKTSTRDRILTAARHLFQQRGYYGVGVAEILAASRAPKGSMYHHFPGGKEQIAIEAIAKIHTDVLALMRKLQADRRPSRDIVRVMANGMSRWLELSSWREGALLASTTIGCVPDSPRVHAAIRAALDAWREEIRRLLIVEKRSKADARRLADTTLAAMEGAMILARVDRDAGVVKNVAESLATLIGKPKNSR